MLIKREDSFYAGDSNLEWSEASPSSTIREHEGTFWFFYPVTKNLGLTLPYFFNSEESSSPHHQKRGERKLTTDLIFYTPIFEADNLSSNAVQMYERKATPLFQSGFWLKHLWTVTFERTDTCVLYIQVEDGPPDFAVLWMMIFTIII